MKRNALLIYPIFIICVLLSSCKSETRNFSDLLKSKDLEKAYEFRTKYPESSLAIDSLIAEIEYPKLLESKNIKDYEEFLTKHQYSRLVDSVKMKLSELRWLNILDGKPTLDMHNPSLLNQLEKYLKDCPNSIHLSQIEEWYFNTQESGTFTDNRDRKKYRWKKIGSQIWMTDRLEYRKYYEKPVMNSEDWWKYSYSELSTACPPGWHVPTQADWIKAIEFASQETFDVEKNNNGIYDFEIKGFDFFSKVCQMQTQGGPRTPLEQGFWSMSFDNTGLVGLLYINYQIPASSGSYNCIVDFMFSHPDSFHTVICVKDSN
jgi:uncharacterized protein (TIGR02145 family)